MKFVFCLAMVVGGSGGLFADNPSTNLGNVLYGIEGQVPEVKATSIATGTSVPPQVWQGEDNGAGEFILQKNPGGEMRIMIARYASDGEAKKAVKQSLRERQAAAPRGKKYKGATLYQYLDGGTIICRSGNYVIEIEPVAVTTPIMMKVLDAILDELAASRKVAVVPVKLRFVSADSEETNGEDGSGKNAVDGNPNTYWHIQWQGNSPGCPHEIVIELEPPVVIQGFSYLPRQDESDHGTIKDYEFYASNDGTNFGQPVIKGAFGPGKDEKVEMFEPIKCRFIKLKALSEINGLPWTSAAEIGVIQPGEDISPGNHWRSNIGPPPAPQDFTKPTGIDSFVTNSNGLNSAPQGTSKTIAGETASTNSIKIIGTPSDVTVKLVMPGKTLAVPAKRFVFGFTPTPKSGLAGYPFAVFEIHDPVTGKIIFTDADPSFFVPDSSGLRGYLVAPFVLIWSESLLELPGAAGDDSALAEFKKDFSAKKFDQHWGARLSNRIGLGQAVPRFYFSDGPYPGGATPMPAVEAVSLAGGVMELDICNPVTKIPASFWIDLRAGKVIKSIVNGEKMDLSAIGTPQPFAVPLKTN